MSRRQTAQGGSSKGFMKIITFAFAIVTSLGVSMVGAQDAGKVTSANQAKAVVEQLKRMTQELLDAVAPGDVAVWRRYLAEGCLYTDEEGAVKTKEDLLKEFKPLPQGYVGSNKIDEPK